MNEDLLHKRLLDKNNKPLQLTKTSYINKSTNLLEYFVVQISYKDGSHIKFYFTDRGERIENIYP